MANNSVQPATTTSRPHIAQDAVFNTYELLEAIILNLSIQNILLAAKVNDTWYDIISTSAPILNRVKSELPAQCAAHSAQTGEWCLHKHFVWAEVFICRCQNTETIVLLPTGSRKSKSRPPSTSPRPVIVNDKDVVGEIASDDESDGWLLGFTHMSTGWSNVGFCSRFTAISQYLDKYHGKQ